MLPFSRLHWWGLRIKILVWSFLPTALALVAVGLVSFYAFQTTTQQLLIERNRELIRVLATQVAAELETYPALLADLTRSPGFAAADASQEQAALQQARNTLVVFDGGVVVTDAQGIVIAAQPPRPDLVGQDWSGSSFFRSILRSRQPAFSDVTLNGEGRTPAIVAAVPVTGPQDEFLGMAAGLFRMDAPNISTFYGNIVKLRIGESEEAHLNTYLVDGGGQIIYHNNRERTGQDFTHLPVVQNFLAGNYVDEFSRPSPAAGSFSGRAGAIRTHDADGEEVVAYFAAIPGTSWGLVSESSWRGLLSYYRTYLAAQSFLFVLGVLAPAVLVSYGIRRITEPIYEIKQAAEDVAGGNFGRQVQVNTGDELEELGLGFNHMSAQLSQSYTALREREERLGLVLKGTNDGIWDWDVQTDEVYYSPRWRAMLGYAGHEINNRFEDWLNLVHPDDAELAISTVREHIANGQDTFILEHRLRHKDGVYRWVLARGILLRDEHGRPVRMVGSHSDITQRRQAEEDLRRAYETLEERVAERTKYLAALNTISALVNRSLDISQTLGSALDQILEIAGMEHGAAYRLEGDREGVWLTPEEAAGYGPEHLFLNPLVSRNLPEDLVDAPGRLPLQGSGVEAFLESHEPLVCNAPDGEPCSGIPAAFAAVGVAQLVSIPLTVKGRLIGAIQVGNCGARRFSPEEMDLLSAIGQQVGISAENARLHEAVQQTATLEERARLARELHDSVTQSLYSVTLLAAAATRLLAAGDTQTASDHLQELREAAQESLREMRLLIYELRPVALEKSGLADALRLRLEGVESRSGIKTELQVDGAGNPPYAENLTYDQKSELYQMGQEILNNILKHSHATQVQVRLAFLDESIRMEIVDNGVGFDPQAAAGSGGMGLAGLAERAHKIGGKLTIDSAPGRGTSISVEAPAVQHAALS